MQLNNAVNEKDIHTRKGTGHLSLVNQILKLCDEKSSMKDLLIEISKLLLILLKRSSIELCIKEKNWCYCSEIDLADPESPRFFRISTPGCKLAGNEGNAGSGLRLTCNESLKKMFLSRTESGSFVTGNIRKDINLVCEGTTISQQVFSDGAYPFSSLVCIPLEINSEHIGFLQIRDEKEDSFSRYDVLFFEQIAQLLDFVLLKYMNQFALNERVKELTCLYNLTKISENEKSSLEEMLQQIVELIPPAWQFPHHTASRICIDGRSFQTANFRDSIFRQASDIVTNNKNRGCVEVVFVGEKIPACDDPFLDEEQKLLNTISHHIELIIARFEVEKEKAQLQEQLRHADRLATIGQLSAGVAHELNEPLNNILGLAELMEQSQGLTSPAAGDIKEIKALSLHAREIIKKLMLFARQVPPQKLRVNLNQIIEDGLYLLESRCASSGIELIRSLSPTLPEITADSSQLTQVLINLVVNAIQAMPGGGKLTIATAADKEQVVLMVQDTGIGMSEEVKKQIFLPFFTTKDIDKGTGLGLSVVHGIVTSHGGKITVESTPGEGAQFEIRLPLKNPRRSDKDRK